MATTDERSLADRIRAVRNAKAASFVELVTIAGLDRRTAFRFADLSGVDLRNQDLQGFDFTGADLRHAMLDGAKLQGAVLLGAQLGSYVDDAPSASAAHDLLKLSDKAIAELLSDLFIEEAWDLYGQLDEIGRGTPVLFEALMKVATEQESALRTLRRFFRIDWSGRWTYRIIKRLVSNGIEKEDLDEALALTGYQPNGPGQVGWLIKVARTFDTANYIYRRFERFGTPEHLVLLGSRMRVSADFEYLHELAARYSTGKDRDLLALRAMPSGDSIREILHTLDPVVANHSMVQVIFAEKVKTAEDALLLIAKNSRVESPMERILMASITALSPLEALVLVRALAGEHTPLRVGGDIWTELVLRLYLKRTDVDWRVSMFNDYVQWGMEPAEFIDRVGWKFMTFRDKVELASLFISVKDFDLRRELSHFERTGQDEIALDCAEHAVRAVGNQGTYEILNTYRALLRKRLPRRARGEAPSLLL
ncbi:hypothetical protein ASG47_07160 [Devosia sp. Leaf420]|uniref:pentapeptide repeat-containing protein n=1 Tax=Devosia sp. Leaf420 TaxID=1736374 RepID=UPI000714C0AE|nr:pentapeptide repeat-containing protein [Devosia sp. Leaf420]KQT48145.1 hypothetical protein ASG47_07160 [Devosia sp. Leaf420]